MQKSNTRMLDVGTDIAGTRPFLPIVQRDTLKRFWLKCDRVVRQLW